MRESSRISCNNRPFEGMGEVSCKTGFQQSHVTVEDPCRESTPRIIQPIGFVKATAAAPPPAAAAVPPPAAATTPPPAVAAAPPPAAAAAPPPATAAVHLQLLQ